MKVVFSVMRGRVQGFGVECSRLKVLFCARLAFLSSDLQGLSVVGAGV